MVTSHGGSSLLFSERKNTACNRQKKRRDNAKLVTQRKVKKEQAEKKGYQENKQQVQIHQQDTSDKKKCNYDRIET
ncbi:hypothetical protein FCULG_00006982 [Fusarium culmorum]|uniref:Uncharacterized protein n=1 Tax=Fusarium culmorum TaxID=5516 RepID=A0A2T4GTB3_FUSCU|nr:hypothetical protein FCULG_00006982 [Fusarium culmorum]